MGRIYILIYIYISVKAETNCIEANFSMVGFDFQSSDLEAGYYAIHTIAFGIFDQDQL